MKVEWRLFTAIACFVAGPTVVYGLKSHERAGTVLMAALSLGFLFIGTWLFTESRHVGTLPEDDPNANPHDDLGEVGFFPTGSVWPVAIGTSATIVGYGLAFTAWVAVPGLALLALAIIGYAAEAQRSLR